MSEMQRLIADLDAVDDFVRNQMRHSVATLRAAQSEIDRTVADLASGSRSTPAPAGTPAGRASGTSGEGLPTGDIGTDAGGARYLAHAERPTIRADVLDDAEPPSTWLV